MYLLFLDFLSCRQCRMTRKHKIFETTTIKGTLISIFALFLLLSCEPNKKDLIGNLTTKEKEIIELKSFFNSIVPEGYSVFIEFKNKEEIDLWVFDGEKNSFGEITAMFMQWSINPYDYKEETPIPHDSTKWAPKTKSLELVKQKLKWTDDTFREIKEMLDNANCISIKNGDPTKIGFARRGLGKYSYLIFGSSISDSLKTEYNNNCTHIFYSDKVILEWGGGAIGSQCFPCK